MSLNLNRIADETDRSCALVFSLTGICELAFHALGSAYNELGEAIDDDLAIDTDSPEYSELYDLLNNLESLALDTRLALASLTPRP